MHKKGTVEYEYATADTTSQIITTLLWPSLLSAFKKDVRKSNMW